MFFFSVKKAFFDAWDNLGIVILSNLSVMLILMAGLWPMLTILETGRLAGLFIILLLVPALSLVLTVISYLQSRIADYRRPSWSEILPALVNSWKFGVLFGGMVALFFGFSIFGMSYYMAMGNIMGLALTALLFWMSVAGYLVALWFLPVRNRLTGGFWKLLKKSSLIMMDNVGLSLFLGFIAVPVQLLLWPLTAFGGFGPAGILLQADGMLRLLIFKYDWLEENPESRKAAVPWPELLVDERERVGKRTLKGMIFPWKE